MARRVAAILLTAGPGPLLIGLFQILGLPLAHPDEASQRSDVSKESSLDGTNTSTPSERRDDPLILSKMRLPPFEMKHSLQKNQIVQ